MEEQNFFGKQVLECKMAPHKAVLKKFLWSIPFLIFVVGAIAMMMNPVFFAIGEDERYLPFFILGVGLLGTLAIVIRIRYYEAFIYERGVVLKKGKKVTELSFDQIEGIADYDTVMRLAFLIPVAKIRNFNIEKKDGKKVEILGMTMPNFKQFRKTLSQSYTEYMIAKVSQETLDTLKITFGEELKLDNGQFIYKNGKTVIPLKDIQRVETQGGLLKLKGINGKGKEAALISTPIGRSLNVDFLYYLVDQ